MDKAWFSLQPNVGNYEAQTQTCPCQPSPLCETVTATNSGFLCFLTLPAPNSPLTITKQALCLPQQMQGTLRSCYLTLTSASSLIFSHFLNINIFYPVLPTSSFSLTKLLLQITQTQYPKLFYNMILSYTSKSLFLSFLQ